MAYYRKMLRAPLGADTAHGPSWYRAMGSISSQPPGQRVRTMPRVRQNTLGSLGDDAPAGTTLSQPTVTDPATLAWQANVLARLDAGVATMQKAELQKWLQIAATVSIPLAAAIWKMIFKGGAKAISDTGL